MIVIVGCLVVIGCVLGGFSMAGGNVGALIHPSEIVTIGGAALGALHHKGLGVKQADRDRLAQELTGGKAAVGTVVDSSQAEAVSAKLAELGGAPESHEIDDAAMAEVDAAAEEAPQEAPVA